MIDFEEDVAEQAAAGPNAQQLKTISTLAQRQKGIERAIKEAEERLENLKGDLRKISEVDLPLAMQEVGMKEFRLEDGTKISIKKELYASITEANKPAAFKWLEDQGLAAVIKNDYTVGFGRGEQGEAQTFEALIKENGFAYKRKEAIHPSTLKALVKEQIEAGVEIPLDVFGVHEVNKSKVEL